MQINPCDPMSSAPPVRTPSPLFGESRHAKKADPSARKIQVSPELFNRLCTLRAFYGDVDIAHMLDRMTEIPASRIPGYTEYPTPESGHCD